MMRGVYVRAIGTNKKWGAHDVMDLCDESFRAFVVWRLAEAGMVVRLAGEEPPTLYSTKPTEDGG